MHTDRSTEVLKYLVCDSVFGVVENKARTVECLDCGMNFFRLESVPALSHFRSILTIIR